MTQCRDHQPLTNNGRLEFDDAHHVYTYDAQTVPSVTQALQDGGIVDYSGIDPQYAVRGTHIHQMLEYYDQGELDITTVDPMYRGYLDAWQQFVQDNFFKATHVEEMVYNHTHRYAGTIDRIGLMGERPAILDIKTAQVKSDWWGIQLAAYKKCVVEPYNICHPDVMRVTVRVHMNGGYKVDTWEDETDFSVFLGALAVRNWKSNKGLI